MFGFLGSSKNCILVQIIVSGERGRNFTLSGCDLNEDLETLNTAIADHITYLQIWICEHIFIESLDGILRVCLTIYSEMISFLLQILPTYALIATMLYT